MSFGSREGDGNWAHNFWVYVYIDCLLRLPKNETSIIILKVATAVFVETGRFQHCTLLIPQSRSFASKSFRENARIRIAK